MSKAIRLAVALKNEIIHRIPYILISLVVILFAAGMYKSYRKAADSVEIAKQNSEIAKQNTTDLKKILCEDIPDNQCNFSKVVKEILADHERQDRFESCLLALSGAPNFEGIDTSVIGQCQKISQNVDIGDVTKSNSSAQPTSQNPTSNTNMAGTGGDQPQAPKENIIQKTQHGVSNLAKRVKDFLGL